MSALRFEMEDINESKLTETTFRLLDDFLQPHSPLTLTSTAQEILAFVPENAVGTFELHSFNMLCIEFGEQIPYHHPSQHKLAALLEHLAESSKLTKTSIDIHVDWLGGALRDSSGGPDPRNLRTYVNFHAFAANIFERRLLRTGSSWAIYALSDALEGARQGHNDDDATRDTYVLGAAQWILFYGQSLFKQVIFPKNFNPRNPDDLVSPDTGPLYKGKPGLCLERWHFWRDGFHAVALGGEKHGYGQECVKVAAKAADLMEALEVNMTF